MRWAKSSFLGAGLGLARGRRAPAVDGHRGDQRDDGDDGEAIANGSASARVIGWQCRPTPGPAAIVRMIARASQAHGSRAGARLRSRRGPTIRAPRDGSRRLHRRAPRRRHRPHGRGHRGHAGRRVPALRGDLGLGHLRPALRPLLLGGGGRRVVAGVADLHRRGHRHPRAPTSPCSSSPIACRASAEPSSRGHYVLLVGFGALVAVFGWQVAELNSQSFSPALDLNLRLALPVVGGRRGAHRD